MSTIRTTYRINDIKDILSKVQMNYNDANEIAKYLEHISDDSKVLYRKTLKLYTPDLSKVELFGCDDKISDVLLEFAKSKMNYDDNIDDSGLVLSMLSTFIDNLKVDRVINKDDSITYTIKSAKGDNKIDWM